MDNEPTLIDENEDQPEREADIVERRTSSLPLILTIIALLVWFTFQTIQLVIERDNLSTLNTNLDGAVQESQKMQSQLHSLITKTAELANEGNAGARAAVEELEKKGIPIKAAAQAPK